MSDQDVAPESQESPQPDAPAQIDLDVLAKKIAQITNEDGKQKYDSIEKAVESIPHKEEFIKKLQEETANERTARQALEERLKELETKVSIEDRIADKLANQQNQGERPSAVELDENKLGDLVAQQLKNLNTQSVREQNSLKFVEAIASETKDVEAFIKTKANSLGIGENTFKDLIAQSPDAALQLIGSKQTVPTKTKTNLNTTGFQQSSTPPDTKRMPWENKASSGVARASAHRERIEAQLRGN